MRALAIAVLLGAWGLGACGLSGCGPAVSAPPAPAVPSTHRDPPPHVPSPRASASTGETAALAASASDEQARELVVAFVIGVRDQDVDAVAALMADVVYFSASLRSGRTPASVGGTVLASQIVGGARAAQLRSDARFEEIVDPASVRVDPVAIAFPEGIPSALEPADRLVRFALSPAGRRALAPIAPEGNVALIVRTGEGARIVAR